MDRLDKAFVGVVLRPGMKDSKRVLGREPRNGDSRFPLGGNIAWEEVS